MPTIFSAAPCASTVSSAAAAIERDVARPLGLSITDAALGIIKVVDAGMAAAIRLATVERGRDPRHFTLVAFGGAGPMHAAAVARMLGIPRVLVPPSPGVLCALGLLVADVRTELSRTVLRSTDQTTPAELAAIFADLEDRAVEWARRGALPVEKVTLARSIEMRYARQNHELAIQVGNRATAAVLARRFHQAHRQAFGYASPDEPTELVTFRVTATLPVARPAIGGSFEPGDPSRGVRAVYFESTKGFVETPVLERRRLAAGRSIDGPAVIEQIDCTTVVEPGQTAAVDPDGNLVIPSVAIRRRSASSLALTLARSTYRDVTPRARPSGGALQLDPSRHASRRFSDRLQRSRGMDLMTVEVLQKLLLATAEEMGITLIRAAYSPNIKERRDASCAVFDAEGRVIAQAAHIPMHLSSMVDLPRALAEAYPRRSWRPGDMYVANDPYTSAGSHLNDIAIIAPVFADRVLIGYVANTAHHADVGGRVPGSESGDSTSIFQDGLRLPVARLVTRGRIEDGLYRTILMNSRTPRERTGDLRAQIAANRAGSERLREICLQYGADALARGMAEILDATERRLRDGIARMPDGCYEAEGFCDDDGREARPVRIRVAVRIAGERVTLDFTGSEAQVPGAKNVPPVSLLATVYYVLKAVIDPDIPPNGGYYRAIEVVAPEGTVLNPRPPAAVAARFTTCQTVADVVLSAFSQVVPERVVAHCHGGTLAIYSGTDPRRGEFFVDYEVYAGGSGARATKDGIDGIANHTTNTSNLPIEALESEFPILVERYAFVPDTGGPGRYRGGLSVVREVRGLHGDLTVGGWGCNQREAPRGLGGGGDGVPGAFEIAGADGTVRETARSTVPGLLLRAGEALQVRTSGGGGSGDPLDRDPGLVLNDVRLDKITTAHAEAAYGVVLRSGEVDDEATRRLRADRRARRESGV